MCGEICVGLGEALVGNDPGRALGFRVCKRRNKFFGNHVATVETGGVLFTPPSGAYICSLGFQRRRFRRFRRRRFIRLHSNLRNFIQTGRIQRVRFDLERDVSRRLVAKTLRFSRQAWRHAAESEDVEGCRRRERWRNSPTRLVTIPRASLKNYSIIVIVREREREHHPSSLLFLNAPLFKSFIKP